MDLIDVPQYLDSVRALTERFPYWDELDGKTLLLSGASGMIGSVLVDAIMLRNEELPKERRCRVIAVGRSRETMEKRFPRWLACEELTVLLYDVQQPFGELPGKPDYLIHAASNTHPLAYATEPIDTILANVLGTKNLLDLTARYAGSRFLLFSSVEIYGENRGDTEYFSEDYCGYLNCNTLRAGYPEAKRLSETLCQAYIEEKHVDAAILRLPRCFGPSMRRSDTKAIAQFIKKAVNGEDIVLKSEGTQLYSYAYVPDAALGVLYALLRGKTGEAYNLASNGSNAMLRDLARSAADCAGTKVVFELPDEKERKGYSTATKALLGAEKLRELGWDAAYDIRTGMRETIEILRQVREV